MLPHWFTLTVTGIAVAGQAGALESVLLGDAADEQAVAPATNTAPTHRPRSFFHYRTPQTIDDVLIRADTTENGYHCQFGPRRYDLSTSDG